MPDDVDRILRVESRMTGLAKKSYWARASDVDLLGVVTG